MAIGHIAARMVETPWRTCATCDALANLPKADAKALRALLANKGIRYKSLAAELAADPEAPSIPWEALSRHARGDCAAKERLR